MSIGSAKVRMGVVLAAVLLLFGAVYVAYWAAVGNSSAPALPPPIAASAPSSRTATSNLSGPLEPVSAEQLRQIRVAIYQLRFYKIGAHNDDWVKAMQSLAQIGRPAVPELVAELDRTTSDRTLRALAFTLRAIGDPRACPALIRAINKTPPRSNDDGIQVDDPSAAQFMHSYELDHDARLINYGRAVREICAALETITKHNEGKPSAIDARSDSAAELAKEKRLHEAMTTRWQSWWNAHHEEVVTDADLGKLKEQPDDAAEIKSAGEAVYGPLFPTGAAYHLGPVHELVLHLADERFDTSEFLDFDAEQKLSYLDGFRRTSPTESFYEDKEAVCSRQYRAWKPLTRSVKLATPGGTIAVTRRPDETTGYFWLHAVDEDIWPVDDSQWETLDEQIKRGDEIVDSGATGEFWMDRRGVPFKGRFPATFLFRTQKGGAGIVQLLGSDEEHGGVRLRYRMVEPHPVGNFRPRTMAPLPDAAPFGSVNSVVLQQLGPGKACVLDLDTGEVMRWPSDMPMMKQNDWPEGRSFAVAKGPDLKYQAVVLRRVAGIGISDGGFDTISPAVVKMALYHKPGPVPDDAQWVWMLFPDPGEVIHSNISTVIFRTKIGTCGVVQIVRTPAEPGSITVRWKWIGKN
jgi:hypothetical protein